MKVTRSTLDADSSGYAVEYDGETYQFRMEGGTAVYIGEGGIPQEVVDELTSKYASEVSYTGTVAEDVAGYVNEVSGTSVIEKTRSDDVFETVRAREMPYPDTTEYEDGTVFGESSGRGVRLQDGLYRVHTSDGKGGIGPRMKIPPSAPTGWEYNFLFSATVRITGDASGGDISNQMGKYNIIGPISSINPNGYSATIAENQVGVGILEGGTPKSFVTDLFSVSQGDRLRFEFLHIAGDKGRVTVEKRTDGNITQSESVSADAVSEAQASEEPGVYGQLRANPAADGEDLELGIEEYSIAQEVDGKRISLR